MKQLLILSGKGGTGKTTVASAFIKLSNAKAFADCDVDAPNLHLVIKQQSEPKKNDYYGMGKAVIDKEKCIRCGLCQEKCRFDAISDFKVNIYECEGCGVCQAVCPVQAINLCDHVAGETMLYNDGDTVFSTAQLKMGSGTSGKLVTEVKRQMTEAAKDEPFAIIDGSPGIGCPVIASTSGVSMVLIVTEPSLSGISDMDRIIRTAKNFGVKIAVCINKYDINKKISYKIESICNLQNIPFLGKIPFDPSAVKAVNSGNTIVDIDCMAGRAVKEVYAKTIKILNS